MHGSGYEIAADAILVGVCVRALPSLHLLTVTHTRRSHYKTDPKKRETSSSASLGLVCGTMWPAPLTVAYVRPGRKPARKPAT